MTHEAFQRGHRRSVAWGVLVVAGMAMLLLAGSGFSEEGVTTKYLALDSRVVESTENARLRVGMATKYEGNPLFVEDKPWEPRFDNLYANVLYDEEEGLYKCWYSPFIRDPAVTETPREQQGEMRYRPHDRVMGVCYATSKDGFHWDKPLMDIREFDGRKSNLVDIGPHGAGVFKDLRETDPARRYKMFFVEGTMCVSFSPDGLHWGEPIACPQIDAKGDTHNNALWAPELGNYVAITRLWDKVRQVGRTESADFVHWTKAEVVLQGQEKHLQTYAMPVFRHAGVYVGLPVIFNTKTDRAHTELAWSPDTITWHRVNPGTPLIPNAEEEGAYDWGCVYAAAYPVILDDEIRLYYGGSNGPHTNWRDGFFCLATLRPDGFAGYAAETPAEPAIVTTVPLALGAGKVRVTADVADGGMVGVCVVDGTGRVCANSEPLRKSATDTAVVWTSPPAEMETSGKDLRLRFTLRNATLYAFAVGG